MRATNKPGLGCSWSRQDGIPVENWNAEDTEIQYRDRVMESYNVRQCPLYLPDGKRMRQVVGFMYSKAKKS